MEEMENGMQNMQGTTASSSGAYEESDKNSTTLPYNGMNQSIAYSQIPQNTNSHENANYHEGPNNNAYMGNQRRVTVNANQQIPPPQNNNYQGQNTYQQGYAGQQGQRGPQMTAPAAYINPAQYSNNYNRSQYTGYAYAKPVKPKKEKKSHPVFKKIVQNIGYGLLFGLFVGLGIYMIFGISGFNGRLAKVQEAYSAQAIAKAEPPVEEKKPEAAPPKEEINADNEIKQVETVTAVVTDVTEVVKKVMPCVVSITNLYTAMDWYGEAIQETASGSGIIVGENDDELLIVTNYHVIEGSDELIVQFVDDLEVLAYVKGTDSINDLAVLAVFLSDIDESTKEEIAVATLGDSDKLQVGEPAIAIGNSLGYGQSVTTGVISALNRELTVDDNTSYLVQTDAAINPGNSGGALLNVKGEVIGINSNKIADYVIEGMGYAIPITTAKPVIEELMQHETKKKVSDSERSFLGISGTDVTSDVSEMYDMPRGVYIAQVLENSGAEKAGLLKGDVITKFEGETVTSMTRLQEILEYYAVGTIVDITVMRQSDNGYQEHVLSVELGPRTE